MNNDHAAALSKVPEITLGFWAIKILATTLGETGGDAVTMSMNLGYAIGTAIFFGVFIISVAAQIKAEKFQPLLYWTTIIATTTVGTTMADYVDRSLGVGYFGGSLILFSLLMATLVIWHYTQGTISVKTVAAAKIEIFYWTTILFSQTLGTALGDWMATTNELGYSGGALVFGAGIMLVAFAYFRTSVSHTILFWIAFILTRPLGATLGDLLDKPVSSGGFAVSRYEASEILTVLIVALLRPQPGLRRLLAALQGRLRTVSPLAEQEVGVGLVNDDAEIVVDTGRSRNPDPGRAPPDETATPAPNSRVADRRRWSWLPSAPWPEGGASWR